MQEILYTSFDADWPTVFAAGMRRPAPRLLQMIGEQHRGMASIHHLVPIRPPRPTV